MKLFNLICFAQFSLLFFYSCTSKEVEMQKTPVAISGLVNELSFTDSIELDVETAKEVTYASSIETKTIETDSIVLELASSANGMYAILTSCQFSENAGIRTETIYKNNDPILLRIERYTGESCWINSDVTYAEYNYFKNGRIEETIIQKGLNSNRPMKTNEIKTEFTEDNFQQFLSK